MAKVQPKSPQDKGVDPLTKGETLYPREDTKTESEKIAKKADTEVAQENQEDESEVEENVADQKAVRKTEDKAAEKTADEKSNVRTSDVNEADQKALTDAAKAKDSDTPKSGTTEPKTS